MIQRKTWTDFINEGVDYEDIYQSRELINKLSFESGDTNRKKFLLNTFDNTMYLLGYKYRTAGVNPVLSSWKDMPIWISSYKPFTRKDYYNKVFFDLMRYVDSFNLLLTNNGFTRSLIRNGALSSSTDSTSKNKEYNSETPQVSSNDESLDNLEYLSNASKVFNTSSANSSQNDKVEETSKSWEEQKKNLELVYFRDICGYIMKIPYLLYDYFALDTYPFPEAIERFNENIKVIIDYE